MSARQHLYFIANPLTGMVKIGVSNNIEVRCDDLSRASGVRLVVLSFLALGERFEKDLHCAFYEDRTVGEWFVPSGDLLALVDEPTSVSAWLQQNAARVVAGRSHADTAKALRLAERMAAAAEEKAKAKALRDEAKRAVDEARAKSERVRQQQIARRRTADAAKVEATEKARAEFLAKRLPVHVNPVTPDQHALVSQRIRNALMVGLG